MATSKRPGVFERVTPPERLVPPVDAWRLAELRSACGDEALAAPARFDPYWGGMWSGGSSATWVSHGLARLQHASGLGAFPDEMVADRGEALDRFMHQASKSTYTLNDRLSFLGVVHGWRTCNAQQVAAMIGNASLAKPTSKVATAAFASGLVDLAAPSLLRRGPVFGPESLYRPGRVEAFESLNERLTWAEWLSVTGGQAWTSGGQFDRHNLLATELGLRLAEYTEVGTVLGERFSTVDLLTGSGVGRAEVRGDRRTADMVVVRGDGMRVAVEVTATVSPYFDSKVERWARLLAESPFPATGLTVVFLVAQPVDDVDATRLRSKTYQAVMRAVRKHPGVSVDPTALRIGVATWREWFPSAHTASEAFLTLRAHRPVDGWSDADFLDPGSVPFAAADPALMRAVFDNASMLGQTPYWLREPSRAPSLAPELLAANGLAAVPAFHAGPDPATGPVVDTTASRGVTPAPRLPKRLLGLSG